MVKYNSNKKLNAIILTLSLIGFVTVILGTNFLGLRYSFLNGLNMYWRNDCNPFSILIALSLFNIFKEFKFKNKIIDYVASCSMIIYLIHENFIVRNFYRPLIWNYIYNNVGFDYVCLLVFAFSLSLFVISFAISIAYSLSIQRVTKFISKKLAMIFDNFYNKFADFMMRIK